MVNWKVCGRKRPWNHVYGLCPSSNVSFKNTTFQKLDLFPSSGKMKVALTLLGPLERGSLNHWTRINGIILICTEGFKSYFNII
jgi:hypothetical protein